MISRSQIVLPINHGVLRDGCLKIDGCMAAEDAVGQAAISVSLVLPGILPCIKRQAANLTLLLGSEINDNLRNLLDIITDVVSFCFFDLVSALHLDFLKSDSVQKLCLLSNGLQIIVTLNIQFQANILPYLVNKFFHPQVHIFLNSFQNSLMILLRDLFKLLHNHFVEFLLLCLFILLHDLNVLFDLWTRLSQARNIML